MDENLQLEEFLRQGLSSEQVAAGVAAGESNTPVDAERTTLKDIIFENLFTYFNLIFLIITICLILVRSFKSLTFLPVIIANILIGIIQEWRSKKVLDKLTIMSAPQVTVIRDGKEQQVPSAELVKGDLACFGAGNQIPADAIVLAGEVSMNEALLTGEADEIRKKSGDELLSGSFVVSGQCRARLERVGAESYSSRLTLEAKERRKGEQSEMIRSLDRLVKIVGILIIPIAATLFIQQYKINHEPLQLSVTSTVAAILGMIPEGLYLLASVAMAVSAMRLALNKVLIHNMKSIETLARADVLCVDKTGTITENTMVVKQVVPFTVGEDSAANAIAQAPDRDAGSQMIAADAGAQIARAQAAGAAYTAGEAQTAGKVYVTEEAQTIGEVQTTGVSQTNGGVQTAGDAQTNMSSATGENTAETSANVMDEMDPAQIANDVSIPDMGTNPAGRLQETDYDYAADDDGRVHAGSLAGNYPAASEALLLRIGDFAACMGNDNITMKAVKSYFNRQSGRQPEMVFPFSPVHKYSGATFSDKAYVMGAPEFILREQYPTYAKQIEHFALLGYRVLVFGEYEGTLDGGPLRERVTPLGMILLTNPVREAAPRTFRYFEEQGVKVKVISGDNPMTVSEVAMQAGIADAERYVDASTLEEGDLKEAVETYTVFGRVTPHQKRQLVAALKGNGHTVAMTGDGVNDVLALKDADCSIAMASGSDAAAQAAQMVLLESDFSKMPAVVAEGRRVVNNIERTASLFLVKNIFSLLMSIFSIIFLVNYPLEPAQISLISAFTIGIPAFVMALETNTGRITGRFLSNVFFRALPAGMTDFAVISALVIFCREFQVGRTDLSTSCTILLAIVGIMILYRIASPMTKLHWILWVGMIFGILFCMTFMNRIFSISTLSRKSAMLLIIFAIITEPVLRYLSLATKKILEMTGRGVDLIRDRIKSKNDIMKVSGQDPL